ncbi:MAG: hypothetical protein C5B51_08815 [Terriglobia bacterium]|nr:MAG: hypothetical protein C5B51_08815 [Terriglobia bacterium]
MVGPVNTAKNIVLIVDDEPIILRLATAAVADAGFRATVAENGVAGFECFVMLQEEICLVLADVVMPAMNGVQMAQRILAINPAAKILLMSGYSDPVLQTQGTIEGLPFLRKPFLAEDLINKIRFVLGIGAGA